MSQPRLPWVVAAAWFAVGVVLFLAQRDTIGRLRESESALKARLAQLTEEKQTLLLSSKTFELEALKAQIELKRLKAAAVTAPLASFAPPAASAPAATAAKAEELGSVGDGKKK